MWQDDEEVFSGLLTDFYTQLFTSSNRHDLEHILDGVQAMVIDEMRADLAQPYTIEEVDVAIKEMAPLKALSRMSVPLIFSNLLDYCRCYSGCFV